MNDENFDPLDNEKTLLGNSGEPLSIGDLPSMRGPVRRFQAGELILGRYRITGELGQGGMGIVYRCHDEIGGIDVALKALPPELSHNSVEMEEVRENFKLVSRLAHPNIATVRTLEKDPVTGDFYLIMECVEGVNLRQWHKLKRSEMRDAGFGIEGILPIVRQVAAALDYAHSQKIIHRDIKPSNVMIAERSVESRRSEGQKSESPNNQSPITNNCQVKILDFGLAAQIHTSLSRVSQVNHGTSGTGPYMAPEQWRGQVQDAATDQYALAVMVYELLSGRPPFESHDPMVLRGAVLEEKVPMLGTISSNHWKILERALSKDRTARFSSCSEFVAALAEGKAHGAGRRKSPEETRKGTKKWVVGLLVVGLLGAGAYLSSFYQSRRAAKTEPARIVQEQKDDKTAQVLAVQQEPDRPEAQKQEENAASEQKTAMTNQVSDSLATYKIVSGDTLSKIALKVYGDSSRWREIYEANQDVMKAENDLQVGQILRIKTSSEASHPDQRISAVQPQLTSGMDWVSPSTGMEFVPIGAGSFMMGSDNGTSDEMPVHKVTLTSPFWMAKTEVTQAQYQQVMGNNPSNFKGDNFPVETVSWDDAVEFCRKLTERERQAGRLPEGFEYRLPTEAQWEYACRAGTTGDYAGNLDAMAWYFSNSEQRPHPVATKKPNTWGLYDMHGNVGEYCLDWMGAYGSGPLADPAGATSGSRRVTRGGSWGYGESYCRSADRRDRSPSSGTLYLGFRPVVAAVNCGDSKEVPSAVSGGKAILPKAGNGWTSPSTGMEFVWIDALQLWVGKYEVTNGEYRKKEPRHDSQSYEGHSLNGDRQPVVYVNFDDAQAYAKWLTEQDQKSGNLSDGYEYRLPTGDEWVTFAQCGDGREYPWGNNWPPRSSQGNYCGQETKGIAGSMIDGYSDNSVVTCSVEQSVVNPWGLYGVGGNVWECTTERPGGGFDVWRGASWDIASQVYLRYLSRYDIGASRRGYDVGFRLVLSPVDSSLKRQTEKSVGTEKLNAHWTKQTAENGDTTLLDSDTGLTWVQAPHTLPGNTDGMTWDDANAFCENLVYAGRSDWRLPTQAELFTIVPEIGFFKGIQTAGYWGETSGGRESYAFRVKMPSGQGGGMAKSCRGGLYVLPVAGEKSSGATPPMAAVNRPDSIKILNVTSRDQIKEGKTVTFEIELEYNLVSSDEGCLRIGFNTRRPDGHAYSADDFETVSAGTDHVVIKKKILMPAWADENFSVTVLLTGPRSASDRGLGTVYARAEYEIQ